ncbi:MAG: SlyX family protein [Pigmentiphaga sp.]|uniref:SlyX family protein n=1 Tax=Pigmentiphaga sp. TaxID=1977564 RepID=UPI0029A228AF|nr:SlyX family protein [Pigmentiphaga sp.]MDX3904325.1 SlyX family protein [Pigmentiphaga sp.]
MTTPDIERRLTELEIKAGFAEDLLERLNETVFRQQQQIELLARELSALRRQLAESPTPAGPRNPRDDIPPHY